MSLRHLACFVSAAACSCAAVAQEPPPLLARPSPTPEAVVNGDDVWKFAISHPTPQYPIDARSRHLAGAGVFQLIISQETGAVSSVSVTKSTGYLALDRAAVSALKRWKFRPRTVIRVVVPIAFTWPTTKKT